MNIIFNSSLFPPLQHSIRLNNGNNNNKNENKIFGGVARIYSCVRFVSFRFVTMYFFGRDASMNLIYSCSVNRHQKLPIEATNRILCPDDSMASMTKWPAAAYHFGFSFFFFFGDLLTIDMKYMRT